MTTKKTPLAALTPLLHVRQPLPTNGHYSSITMAAFNRKSILNAFISEIQKYFFVFFTMDLTQNAQ
jgi:hypothetical protein